MTDPDLENVYDHSTIETDIYATWEKEGYFRPEILKELGLIDAKAPRY